MIRMTLTAAAAALLAMAAPAAALILTISKAPTQNVTCSNGTCEPSGPHPVLNVRDLENLLASGNVLVSVTNRSRGNIRVEADVRWTTSSTLTLTATDGDRVYIDRPISVAGSGGLAVYGSYLPMVLKQKGKIVFSNLSSSLTIGEFSYTLVGTLPSLASAIAANPGGLFALANSYDASGDGTYTSSPIPTNFLGILEGLGNTISNISVNNTSACCVGGLFQSVSGGAYIMHIGLMNVSVMSSEGAAGLAYESFGSVYSSFVTGKVAGGSSGDIGGLVADNYGIIGNNYSIATVSAGSSVTGVNVGGLVALDIGTVYESFASGNVSAGDGSGNIGGAVGQISSGSLSDCYANGAVSGGAGLNVGGLAGEVDYSDGTATGGCYSAGAVSAGTGSTVGGLIGVNNNYATDDYWDTTTSGTNVGVGLGNAGGVTGLTTAQFQSGLPPGFEVGIWAEIAKYNDGLPYLRQNPPPK